MSAKFPRGGGGANPFSAIRLTTSKAASDSHRVKYVEPTPLKYIVILHSSTTATGNDYTYGCFMAQTHLMYIAITFCTR